MSNYDLIENSTPINYGLTRFAVGSVLVTDFRCSSFLVKNSQLCIVNVVRRRNCGKLGSYVDRSTEGDVIDSTINYVTNDIYSRSIAHFCYAIIVFSYGAVTVINPNPNRDTHESVIKSLSVNTVLLNSNSEKLGNFIILKGSYKTVSNNSTLCLPSVRIIKFKNSNKLIHVSKICNVDINVVDRLCLRCFSGVVMTVELNDSITYYSEGSGNLHRITKLVLNLESNGVNTSAKSNVTLGRKHASVDGRFYNYAVNSDLAGSKVKSCIISNYSRKCNVVTVDHCTVLKRNCSIRGRISRCGNSRKNSIVHSGAVVKSNIVDIEGNYISGIGLYVSTNKGGRTRVLFICCNRHTEIVVLRNVNSHVYPTRLGNICIGSRVKVRLLACSSRCEHKVILLA